jgi:hypothetical protein
MRDIAPLCIRCIICVICIISAGIPCIGGDAPGDPDGGVGGVCASEGAGDKTATIVATPSIKPNATDFMKASLPVAAAQDAQP